MLLGIVMTAAMGALLSSCDVDGSGRTIVGQRTMTGVIAYESGWKPWSIDDNTAHESHSYPTRAEAEREVEHLLAIGHNIDVGLSQVNSANFASYRLDARSALDPCTNVRTGATILWRDYAGAVRRNWIGRPVASSADAYLQEQSALVHALSAYNSGRWWASMRYAGAVYRIALGVREAFRAEPDLSYSATRPVPLEPTIRRAGEVAIHRTSATQSAASLFVSGTTKDWSGQR